MGNEVCCGEVTEDSDICKPQQCSSHFYNEYEIIFADKNSDLSV